MREKNLYEYIGTPFLGLNKKYAIGIDSMLFSYLEITDNSFNLMASLVDLETGEVLVTKDVFEEVDFYIPVDVAWEEDLREHAFNNCCVLAAKFKHHYPLCEGKIIDSDKDIVMTDIKKNDGIKKGMKLLIFDDQNIQEDFPFIDEAKVFDVQMKYSKARLLIDPELENTGNDNRYNMDYKVITR